MSIKHILVPTDFSAPADAALNYALDLAKACGAAVSLVHVFEDPIERIMYPEQYVPMPASIRDEILSAIRRRLEERATASADTAVTTEVLFGPVAQAIVDAARDRHADLLVMGTHGRHGMAHLFLGSVAERVVRTAACPVLTVRSGAGTRAEQAA